jgi:hypothetical protein
MDAAGGFGVKQIRERRDGVVHQPETWRLVPPGAKITNLRLHVW